MDAKELKKLVKVCRDLGVTRYKGPDFEFELSPDAPISRKEQAAAPRYQYEQGEVESDMPDAESLLFWSAPMEPLNGEGDAP